jgi:hypothetical protein
MASTPGILNKKEGGVFFWPLHALVELTHKLSTFDPRIQPQVGH